MTDELTEVLGQQPPKAVAALSDDVRDRLAGQIAEARRRTAEEGQAAADRAIAAVPLPLRDLVRKALT